MDQQTLVFASGTYQGQVKRGKMHGKGSFGAEDLELK